MHKTNLKKGFWQLADPKIWLASTVPMFLGTAIAGAFEKKFHIGWLLFAMFGIYLIEIGKNAVNEYVDSKSGVDGAVDNEHHTPFSGGKKTIISGLLTLNQSAYIAFITLFAAMIAGLVIVFFKEFNVIYIGIIGFGLAIIYSLPPFKLCYRGLGEITVGFVFGPLIVMGIYMMFTGNLDWLPLFASIPIAAIVANILVINQFPDYEADKSGNKKNCVVLLGKEKSVYIYAALFIIAYLGVIATAVFAGNAIWLIALATLPIAYKAVINAKNNFNNIEKLTASNAATIKIYMLTGLLMIIAAILDGLLF